MAANLSLEWVPTFSVDHLEIVSAAFSPDGVFLATGGVDGVVRLWDAAGNQLIRTLDAGVGEHPDTRVLALAFGGDGRRMVLAASLAAGPVVIWSPSDGRRLTVIDTGEKYLWSMAVHPDGTLLAAGVGNAVRLWNPTTGQPVQQLTGHTDRVTQVAFATRGDRLASAGMDCIRLWNPIDGQPITTFAGRTRGGGPAALSAVAFDPTGSRLAGTGLTADGMRIWDTETGRELAVITGATSHAVAFSPDGQLLAHGGLRLSDAATGARICSLGGRRIGAVSTVLFSPDGTHLVTVGPTSQHRLPPGSFDRTFGRWRIREIDPEPAVIITAAASQQTLRHDRNVGSVAFSPDGTCLLTSDSAVRVWQRLDASPVARTLWKASANATFKAGRDAVWSPDGTLVAYSRYLTVVVVADPATGHEIHNWHTGNRGVSGLAFSPDGSRLAGLLGGNSIVMWDPFTGAEIRQLTGERTGISAGGSAPAFSPDGTRLAAGPGDGTYAVDLWHLADGRRVRLYGHTGPVTSVAFDPSGARLASGGWDGSVVLWDIPTGDEIAELTEHIGETHTVAFSPDGTRLATASSDGMVILRHPLTGSPTHRLTGNTGRIWCIAFSPDSAQLAVAVSDATVRLWNLPVDGD